jgi:hypothetical protein
VKRLEPEHQLVILWIAVYAAVLGFVLLFRFPDTAGEWFWLVCGAMTLPVLLLYTRSSPRRRPSSSTPSLPPAGTVSERR